MSLHITILGATSGIGRCALDEAIRRGHTVRAFARSADALPEQPRLERCAGDATNPQDVAQAIADADAVIYALGIEKKLAKLWQEVTLFSQSTQVLLQEMDSAGIRRLLVVTGFGAGRSKAAMSKLEQLGHHALLGRPYADKDRQEPMIMSSDLDWTIVRPVILTNAARSGKYKALREPAEWRNGLISRADVACYLLDAIEQNEDIRRDIVLAR